MNTFYTHMIVHYFFHNCGLKKKKKKGNKEIIHLFLISCSYSQSLFLKNIAKQNIIPMNCASQIAFAF